MKKFFSSVLCADGYCCAYNTIYKKYPSAKVYIVYGGNDFERTVFFNRLIENFKGYVLSVFNPFHSDSADGVFIENINTYIISDSGYSRISPALAGIWEKYYCASYEKNYPLDLRREILTLKAKENNSYKKACGNLKSAAAVKDKIHREFSKSLNDEKIINFVKRFCGKYLKSNLTDGYGEIRLLCSPTPLGIHTHYDTVFEMCENVVSISDNRGFAGAVLLGIIKNYAVTEKIPFYMSPSYFAKDIVQTIIFPKSKLALTVTDENHILPFEASESISASRFFANDFSVNSDKLNMLTALENKFLEDCVYHLYDGREYRFKYNCLCNDFANGDEAKHNADKLCEKLII